MKPCCLKVLTIIKVGRLFNPRSRCITITLPVIAPYGASVTDPISPQVVYCIASLFLDFARALSLDKVTCSIVAEVGVLFVTSCPIVNPGMMENYKRFTWHYPKDLKSILGGLYFKLPSGMFVVRSLW